MLTLNEKLQMLLRALMTGGICALLPLTVMGQVQQQAPEGAFSDQRTSDWREGAQPEDAEGPGTPEDVEEGEESLESRIEETYNNPDGQEPYIPGQDYREAVTRAREEVMARAEQENPFETPGTLSFRSGSDQGEVTHFYFTDVTIPDGNIEQGSATLLMDLRSIKGPDDDVTRRYYSRDYFDVRVFPMAKVTVRNPEPVAGQPDTFSARAVVDIFGRNRVVPITFKVLSRDPLRISANAQMTRGDFNILEDIGQAQTGASEVLQSSAQGVDPAQYASGPEAEGIEVNLDERQMTGERTGTYTSPEIFRASAQQGRSTYGVPLTTPGTEEAQSAAPPLRSPELAAAEAGLGLEAPGRPGANQSSVRFSPNTDVSEVAQDQAEAGVTEQNRSGVYSREVAESALPSQVAEREGSPAEVGAPPTELEQATFAQPESDNFSSVAALEDSREDSHVIDLTLEGQVTREARLADYYDRMYERSYALGYENDQKSYEESENESGIYGYRGAFVVPYASRTRPLYGGYGYGSGYYGYNSTPYYGGYYGGYAPGAYYGSAYRRPAAGLDDND